MNQWLKSQANRRFTVSIYGTLCTLYLGYTLYLFVQPITVESDTSLKGAHSGKLIFQQKNCQACHQFYGLGGYLGPDLTNVFSKFKGNREAIRQVILNGSGQMPAFQLNDKEMEELIQFLEAMNNTGTAHPTRFSIHSNGSIRPKP